MSVAEQASNSTCVMKVVQSRRRKAAGTVGGRQVFGKNINKGKNAPLPWICKFVQVKTITRKFAQSRARYFLNEWGNIT